MKKFSLLFAATLFIIFPVISQAAGLGGLDVTANRAGYTENSVIVIGGNVLNLILSFVGILFLVMTITGGFIWMTAAGNASKVSTAQKLIVAGIIGLIIVVSAYVITTWLGDTTNLGTAAF